MQPRRGKLQPVGPAQGTGINEQAPEIRIFPQRFKQWATYSGLLKSKMMGMNLRGSPSNKILTLYNLKSKTHYPANVSEASKGQIKSKTLLSTMQCLPCRAVKFMIMVTIVSNSLTKTGLTL